MTAAVRRAAFPLDEPIEEGKLEKLASMSWIPPRTNRIYSGPELRCGQTAKALGLQPIVSADLKIVAQLQSIGLPCDGRDGFRGIAACAGSTGCDASLADVRGDAAALARLLAGSPKPSGWTVNLSGCEKQCAPRRGATAEVLSEALSR